MKENAIPGDLHFLRVRIMYQAYCYTKDNNINGAIETLEKGVDELEIASCVYLGEKLFCIDQLMAVCNMLKRMALNKSAPPLLTAMVLNLRNLACLINIPLILHYFLVRVCSI
jgi:hypothetical protein